MADSYAIIKINISKKFIKKDFTYHSSYFLKKLKIEQQLFYFN